MERLIRTGLLAALAALLIPLLVLTAFGAVGSAEEPTETPPMEPEMFEIITVEQEEPVSWDAAQTIRLHTPQGPRELPLSDYLIGVLAGELPRGFEPEAIAAQAVAARTFSLRQMSGGKHDGALCSDAACCQAWVETVDSDWAAELGQAVAATDGQVLCYDGKLIEALFFSCSGGRTEAAVEVWGGELPYLIPVDSPGEESAPRYSGKVECSAADFRERVLNACPEAFSSGTPETWLGQVSHTAGSGVSSMDIGGTAIPGTTLRRLFGLNSTNFTLTLTGETFTFETRGFGHRVGMSQYGANAMAQNGAEYADILAHYYPGTELTCLLEP